MRYLYLFLLLIVIVSCHAQPTMPINKDANTLLWQVSGNGLAKPSYLFGTFHIMCKSDIVFSEHFKNALSASAQVYFEMDISDPKNTLGAIFFMNMQTGTLKELYTAEEYRRVSVFFKDTLSMSLDYMQKWKPMMLEALIYPSLIPCKNASGVDMEILTLAKAQNKPIKGLETIEFQMSVFDSIPYQIQAKSLLKTIDSIETYRGFFTKMVTIYKKQQVNKIMELIADTAYAAAMDNDVMLKNRNENWVLQLKKTIPTTNIFLAVGAAHLFGKDGLIALLRKQGYTVQPIVN